MSRPSNLQRIAVLRHPELMEECVLAIAQGRVRNVVDEPWIGDDDFVAMMTFVKLGRGELRIEGGQRFLVMPVTNEPTVNTSRWAAYRTVEEAIKQLESQKQMLLAANWLQGEFDPVNDPD